MPEATLIIFGDNGGAGRDAAKHAVQAHARNGRRIVQCFPPTRFKDWADMLAVQRA
jgi:hypothetical protein